MIDDPRLLIPPLVATAEAAAPSPELPPADETAQPLPTIEQAEAVDQVFTTAEPHHPMATLFGIATSIALLRDVAVDTFDTSGEEEERKEKAGEDADSLD